MKIKILIPVYNDWQSVFKLLENINSEVSNLDHEFSVIVVNDASTETKPELSFNLEKLNSIKIINMKENRGHARCNAAGLKHIYENEEFDYVIPMDGDGEDRPEEIKQLVDNSSLDSEDASFTIITEKSWPRLETSELIFSKSLKTDFQSL